MITLSLDSEHAEVLQEALQRAVRNLHVEISKTDDREYRAYLKRRRAMLLEVVTQLLAQAA